MSAHPLPIVGIAANGAEIDYTDAPLLTWFRNGFVLGTAMLGVFVLSFFDAQPTSRLPEGTRTALIFWLLMFFVYLALHFAFIKITLKLCTVLKWNRFFLPVMSLPLIACVVLLGEGVIYLLSGSSTPLTVPRPLDFLYFYVVEQIFLTLYASLIHPLVLKDIEANAAQDDIPPSPTETVPQPLIRIERNQYAIEALYYLEAAEHYLYVTTKDQQDFVRARLSNIVQDLGAETGILIHRSHWVGRNAIDYAYTSEDYRLWVVMLDGKEFVVARTRKKQVQDWLAQYGIEQREAKRPPDPDEPA